MVNKTGLDESALVDTAMDLQAEVVMLRREARILRVLRLILHSAWGHAQDCQAERYEEIDGVITHPKHLPCNCGREYARRLIEGPYDHDIAAAEAWVDRDLVMPEKRSAPTAEEK